MCAMKRGSVNGDHSSTGPCPSKKRRHLDDLLTEGQFFSEIRSFSPECSKDELEEYFRSTWHIDTATMPPLEYVIAQMRNHLHARIEFKNPIASHPVVWWDLVIAPLPSASAGQSTFHIIAHDITEWRKELEYKLRNEAELDDFFENGSLCLHWVGPDGTILRANKEELNFLGYAHDEYVGQNIARFHVDQAALQAEKRSMPVPDLIADLLARLARFERIHEYEAQLIHKDGSLRTVVINSSVMAVDGKFVHSRCITRDVTEKRRLERELQRAKEEAEAANQAKDQFIAILSHELRTPLTPVMLALPELQADPRLPESARETLHMLQSNMELEVRLIDDLLDLTAVRKGKMKLHPTDTDIHLILSQVHQIVRKEAVEKNHELIFEMKATTTNVFGDSTRLSQIFWNILRNAIKYTPPGGRIRVTTSNDSKSIKIDFEDNGMGLSPDFLPLVFEPFRQGGRGQGGLGLGLGMCISKSIVDLHGGTISVYSEGKGRGSTFTVNLPLSSSATVQQPSAASPHSLPAVPRAMPPINILVVEDDPTSGKVLIQLLQSRLGHFVDLCTSVQAALERLMDSAKNYDLVISDLGLPDGTGYDLMAKMRAIRPHQKAIVLSGYGMKDDIKKSSEVGFLKHLIKPISFQVLTAAIYECMMSRPQQGD